MSSEQTVGQFGMPEKVSRQWVVEHSEVDELGDVPIPEDRADGLVTHAGYEPDCPHDVAEDCQCYEDDTVMWSLQTFSG